MNLRRSLFTTAPLMSPMYLWMTRGPAGSSVRMSSLGASSDEETKMVRKGVLGDTLRDGA